MNNNKHTNFEELKLYLGRYSDLNRRYNSLLKKYEIINQRLNAPKSPALSGMPRGGTPVTQADLVSEKIDLEKRIERIRAERRTVKNEIVDLIDTLNDPKLIEILESHAIDGYTFEQIAEFMGYTERYIYDLYRNALEQLEKNFNKGRGR